MMPVHGARREHRDEKDRDVRFHGRECTRAIERCRSNGTNTVIAGPENTARAESEALNVALDCAHIMSIRRHMSRSIAVIAALATLTSAHAQQPTAPKILVAGENPAITLRDKEGGAALTSVNFWRVHWSPVGSGAVCYVTVSGQGGGDMRIPCTTTRRSSTT